MSTRDQGRHVPPPCPGPDPGAGWLTIADRLWIPWPAADMPVPYTLTPKALAALDQDTTGWADCPACPGCTWACLACGAAYFGTPPETGLCPLCQQTPCRPCAPPAAPPIHQSTPGPGKPSTALSASPNASSRNTQ